MIRIQNAITDNGNLPIVRGGTSPLTGTIVIGDLTRRLGTTRIHRYFIIRILGSLATTVHIMDTTVATIRIMGTILTQTFTGAIAVATTIPRARGVPTTGAVGGVKIDVHGIRAV